MMLSLAIENKVKKNRICLYHFPYYTFLIYLYLISVGAMIYIVKRIVRILTVVLTYMTFVALPFRRLEIGTLAQIQVKMHSLSQHHQKTFNA